MTKKKLAILLSGVVLSSSICINTVEATAKTQAEINQEIEDNKKEIEKLEKEKDKLKNQKAIENNNLEQLRDKLYEKNTLLNETKQKLNKVKNEMNTLQEKIDELSNNIIKVEKDIEDNKVQLELKKEILRKRIRGMYKSNFESKVIELLLGSDSFGDFISAFMNISKMVKIDNSLIDEIKDIEKQLIEEENKLNFQKDEVISQKKSLEVTKNDFESITKDYQAQVNELKALEDAKLAEINKLTEKEKSIQREIARYEEDNADLKNYFNNTSTSNGQVSASGFIRPASGGITSAYGPRVHPITGKNSIHTGVDFASPYGSPFVAAKDGIVTTVTYHKAYGNMVIIDHGNGVTTLYAHASSFAVSVGQKVKQGDVVCYVGSTGYSTGPHAHFEIRINGQAVNPMNYIK